MISKTFNNRIVQSAIISMIGLVTLICTFPVNFLWFKWIANYAVYAMFLHFILGLLFLIFRQARLTFVAFGACAVLALFLKEASSDNPSVTALISDAPRIKIAHFNLSNSDTNANLTLEIIKNTDADLISIQEITPFWDSLLQKQLQHHYSSNYTAHNVHIFGLAVYAKNDFLSIDTLSYRSIPSIVGKIVLADFSKPIHFISTLTIPPASYKDYTQLTQQLLQVSDYCNSTDGPLFAFGDYHVVPWSNEIQHFRQESQLLDSRQGFAPTYPNGALNFHWTPIDYIFYSPHFNCLNFKTINNSTSTHLGIEATFQLNISAS